MSSYVQRRYPEYHALQTGVQFALTLVDTDNIDSPTVLDIQDKGMVNPAAASISYTMIFRDPSGIYHFRAATPAGSQGTPQANEIIWTNSSDDRLFDRGPPGLWIVSAEAAWHSAVRGRSDPNDRILYEAVSPHNVSFYVREGQAPP